MVDLDVVVAVPRLAVAVPDLDEAHALFEQPPRGEQLPALHVVAVQGSDSRRFARNRKDVGRLHLHAVGEFVGLDPRLQLGVVLAPRRVAGVAAIHQHERRLVIGHVGVQGADYRDVVDARGDVREELADLDAALAVFLKREGRAKGRAGLALGRESFEFGPDRSTQNSLASSAPARSLEFPFS